MICKQKTYAINFYRLKCPKCNKRGRLQISVSVYFKTEHINFGSIAVQHWKNVGKEKKYSHMCVLDKQYKEKILTEIVKQSILDRIKEKIKNDKKVIM